MELVVPTNWQDDLNKYFLSVGPESGIKEIYGKLMIDDIGGGRVSSAVAYVSRRNALKQIRSLQEQGFKFNYLLNSLCMDNLEFTRFGQKKINRILSWLAHARVDSVTVSSFYLAMYIRRNFPAIQIIVSAMANVDSLNRAKFWEQEIGAEKITFAGPRVNRNFQLIRLLRKHLKCKIQLIANNACINNCNNCTNHNLMNSHASQKWHKCRGLMLDYHVVMCRILRFRDYSNFIRSDWIRPEDVKFYGDLGVDCIKLTDRRLPSAKIINIARAYSVGEYKGNLTDLFPIFQGRSFNAHKGWLPKFIHLGNFLSMNPFSIVGYSGLLSGIRVDIDNVKLSGFLENMPEDCEPVSCAYCSYCKEVADRVVSFNRDYLAGLEREYNNALNRLFVNGLTFKTSSE